MTNDLYNLILYERDTKSFTQSICSKTLIRAVMKVTMAASCILYYFCIYTYFTTSKTDVLYTQFECVWHESNPDLLHLSGCHYHVISSVSCFASLLFTNHFINTVNFDIISFSDTILFLPTRWYRKVCINAAYLYERVFELFTQINSFKSIDLFSNKSDCLYK